MTRLGVFVVVVCAATVGLGFDANAGGRLLVVDRTVAKGRARVLFKAPGPVFAFPLGDGGDALTAEVTVRIDGRTTGYSVPAGTYDGVSGWKQNSVDHALFVNRTAPAGTTGIGKASVRATSGVTLVARDLGDTGTPIDVTGASASVIDVQVAGTAAGRSGRLCMHFDPGDCIARVLDGGRGAKLSCSDGFPDYGCTAFGGSPGEFTCTELIGFSQTLMWEETPEFQQQLDDSRWQMRFRSGGNVDLWADPNADGWNAPVRSDCVGGGSPVLCSPCASGSSAPDRVIFTITLDAYESDVQVWIQKIRAAVATIRSRRPQARQIVLQPVVGGPQHTVCPLAGQPQGVRASYNHPFIDAAIAVVVQDSPDLVAGISPEVQACSAYSDDVGHLTETGRGPVGQAIGQYYAVQP